MTADLRRSTTTIVPAASPPSRMTEVSARLRFVALCASVAAFLVTAVFLLLVSVPEPLGLLIAALVSSMTATVFAIRRPSAGWRWGLWASAVFLAYFGLVALAYLIAGRPAWHPVMAALVVTGSSCATAAVVAALLHPDTRGTPP